MTTAQLVREFLSSQRTASTAEMRQALGLAWRQLHSALGDMLERGEISRVSKGKYRWVGVELRVREHVKIARIYKAMHIRGTFSPREIQVLIEASRHLVWKVIRKLLPLGALEYVCKQTAPNGQKKKVYRVTHRDNFYKEYVLPGSIGKDA